MTLITLVIIKVIFCGLISPGVNKGAQIPIGAVGVNIHGSTRRVNAVDLGIKIYFAGESTQEIYPNQPLPNIVVTHCVFRFTSCSNLAMTSMSSLP